jgi:putative endonuclease
MYYVYALLSKQNNDLYLGFTSDLRIRLKQHNNKEVKSTMAYSPWSLIYYEAYKSKFDATKREKQLKMHKAKQDLRLQISNSLKES